jgi:hypothetical protein
VEGTRRVRERRSGAQVILIDSDAPATKLNVSDAKSGRQFDAVILEAVDFANLAMLTPEALHNWLTHWQCGFKPGAEVEVR